jgi:hypothetical protein
MRTIITIVLIALATRVRAELVQSYTLTGVAGGKQFDFQVMREQLLKAPVWRLQDDFPPLSPRKAETLATAKFHELLKDTTFFKRGPISLEDMGDGIHWIYVVEFDWDGPYAGPGTSVPIMILMNGTVIEPKITDFIAQR